MGTMELNAKVQELKELEAMQAEINAEMDSIKDTLKAELARRETDEISVGIFKIRYKTVISKRFDSKAFKELHSDLYNTFTKESKSMRFSVN